jgi:hypothetical protein
LERIEEEKRKKEIIRKIKRETVQSFLEKINFAFNEKKALKMQNMMITEESNKKGKKEKEIEKTKSKNNTKEKEKMKEKNEKKKQEMIEKEIRVKELTEKKERMKRKEIKLLKENEKKLKEKYKEDGKNLKFEIKEETNEKLNKKRIKQNEIKLIVESDQILKVDYFTNKNQTFNKIIGMKNSLEKNNSNFLGFEIKWLPLNCYIQ